ncbi:MAG: hypothetical protein WCS42_17055, partial [Verrucomicrobiota bacterium]
TDLTGPVAGEPFGALVAGATPTVGALVTGVIKDVERLKQLFNLFAETLDELCRMGAAYEKNPGVML